MFTNYPLAVQMLGWAVFMGLNGYIGATCPLLNLAVLAFLGAYANKKTGIILLIIALIITAAESVWCLLAGFASGMSATPTDAPSFMEQGSGILNLLIAGVVFFILCFHFSASFPSPKWLVIVGMVLFYAAGAFAGTSFWFPVVSHVCVLLAIGVLGGLFLVPTAHYAIGIGAVLFLGLAAMYGYGFFQAYQENILGRKQIAAREQFLKAVDDNNTEQVAALWEAADGVQTTGLEKALAAKNEDMVRFLIKQGVQTDSVMNEMIYDKKFWAVQLLVNAGAPITPEHVSRAADYNFMPAIQLFVEKGAAINQKDFRPLSKASESGNLEIVQYLLKTGKNSQGTLNDAL